MAVLDQAINKFIESELIRENHERELLHEPSGKLSASMLYQPLRFQVLKSIGIPRRPFDAYALGKFKRGVDVENWYVSMLDKMGVLVDKQKQVEYRGVVGYVDAVVNSEVMQFKKGIMPHECKSVTNAKLKRLLKTEVDYHYKMQAALYGLALRSEFYAVDIVSAEDLRPYIYVFPTSMMKADIDQSIDRYDEAMAKWNTFKQLPVMEENSAVPWTTNPNYAMFTEEWWNMPTNEVIKKMVELKIIK